MRGCVLGLFFYLIFSCIYVLPMEEELSTEEESSSGCLLVVRVDDQLEAGAANSTAAFAAGSIVVPESDKLYSLDQLMKESRCLACSKKLPLDLSFEEYKEAGIGPVILFQCERGSHALHERCLRKVSRFRRCRHCALTSALEDHENISCGMRLRTCRNHWCALDWGTAILAAGITSALFASTIILVAYAMSAQTV